MLRTLPETQKSRWAEHLNHVVHAYNCTKHEATGYSPFFLLFGHHPRLPVDLMFGIEGQINHENHSQYVEKWRRAITDAYELAGKKSSEVGSRAKQRYDGFVRSSVLLPGDRVLVRNLSERGRPGKLRSHWEDRVHVVVSRRGDDSPVYEVKPESGSGGSRTLHRNLLLPCNYIPMDIPSKSSQKRAGRAQNDQCSEVQQIPTPQVKELSDDRSSDEESAVILTNLHTGQTLEEMVTGEHPKALVEVKPPAPTQPEYAIADNSYQGQTRSDLTVPEGMNDVRSENGDEQDPPTQNDNSQLDSPEPEPRPKRHRHPPTLLTYNTLGNPTYETQAATHVISTNSVLGSQLPQCSAPHHTFCTGLPFGHQFQLPTNSILYQHPVIFGYPSSYLQYPLMSPPVFHPGNQYIPTCSVSAIG